LNGGLKKANAIRAVLMIKDAAVFLPRFYLKRYTGISPFFHAPFRKLG
jgi:hypothetical protein